MKFFSSQILMILMIITSCSNENNFTSSKIDVWYGTNQSFGKLGNTQRQINILGNISANLDAKAVFKVNNSEPFQLTLGSDLHRLAFAGDFNIEIPRSRLNEGLNSVVVYLTKESNVLDSANINVDYTSNQKWSLPYRIKWSEVENIQDVVEVIDGNWTLTDQGIRTKEFYYDRIIAFGDSTWRNYEVETSVIFHGYNSPQPGPPTYDVAHVAIASRWPGHSVDSLQPNRKWHPLGATSEFRIEDDYNNCRWRIFDGDIFYAEQSHQKYRKIKPEIKYKLKHRVEQLSHDQTIYSVKFWNAEIEEPNNWDFQAIENNTVTETGSACLIAHHTDVTFGDVNVIPISQSVL